MYKQLINPFTGEVNSDVILRLNDGSSIPNDLNNRDWVEYQAWLDLGNTPEAA